MLVDEISVCAQQGKAHRAQVKHTFRLGKPHSAPRAVPAPTTPQQAVVPEKKEVRELLCPKLINLACCKRRIVSII